MAVVFLTGYSATDQTYNVPSDWNNSTNTVEVISHAGTGATATSGSGGNGGGGGGGGGYAKATNVTLTPGGTATYRLRDAGAGNADANACWFNGTSLAGSSVGIRGGSNASNATGGAGALTTNAIGATTRAGGTGATASTASGNVAGGGGGGAAGLAGVGGNASGTTGGTGDGGATAATASGTQWDGSHGSGGGGTGGAAGNNAGGNGGQYGAGAGGGGKTNGAAAAAGTSRGGLIVLTYTPAITSKSGSDSLLPKITDATNALASTSSRTDSLLPMITEGTTGLRNSFGTTDGFAVLVTETSLSAEGWDLQVRGVNVTGDGEWSNTASVWLPRGSSISAPTIAWVTFDGTPDLDLTEGTPGDLIEGDTVVFQFDTVNTFNSGDLIETTNTVDAAEALAGTLAFTSSSLTTDTWYARARIDRPGYIAGNWSATISHAIDATAPTITSSSTFSMDENEVAVGTVTAGESATFAITGGADAALFSINSSTGALTFLDAPDYETPLDADTDNDYVVEVTATDDVGNVGTPQSITVTVNDVSEGGAASILDPLGRGPDANITIDGTNLIVTCGATANNASNVRTLAYHRTGVYFASFEVGHQFDAFGICNSYFSIGDSAAGKWLGANTTDSSASYYIDSGGGIYKNGTEVTTGVGTFDVGDIVDLYVDLDSAFIATRVNGGDWNGNVADDPATGSTSISAIIAKDPRIFLAVQLGATGSVVTANFGPTYTYAKPVAAGDWTFIPDTLDNTTNSSFTSISGGNLVSTSITGAGTGSVSFSRGTLEHGYIYIEATLTNKVGGSEFEAVGFANDSFTADSDYIGGSTGLNSIGYWDDGACLFHGNSLSGFGDDPPAAFPIATYAEGDVIGIAIAKGTSTYNRTWFRVNGGDWNNDAGSSPETGLNYVYGGGDDMKLNPLRFAVEGEAEGDIWTVNFGATPFAYARPDGYGVLCNDN